MKDWKKCVMKGITKIGNITDDQGMFLIYSEINQKFNLECNFLEVLQIRQSIPSRRREAIYHLTKCLIDTNVIIGRLNVYLKQHVRMFTGLL